MVRTYFQERNVTIQEQFDDGGICLGDGEHVGLFNVSAQWSSIPKADRPEHLTRFLDQVMLAATGYSANVEAQALRVSLYPAELYDKFNGIVRRKPCASFMAVAMLDMEGAAAALRESDLAGTEITADEAFETGKLNVWRYEPHSVERQEFGDVGQITIVTGESMFTAANALHIERFLNPACESGALFAVPNRHVLALVRGDANRIDDLSRVLAGLAVKASQDQYGITSDLMWWRDGAIQRVGWLAGGRYRIELPEDL